MALTDNLISYWKCVEASGNIIDAHSTNDLTDNNTVTSAAGKINTARQFTKANSEYAVHVSNAALQLGDIDFTYAAWVYIDSNTINDVILSKYSETSQEVYLSCYNVTNRFRFQVQSLDNLSSGAVQADTLGTPSVSTWYYCIAWHDATGNTLNIQVNNGGVDSTSWSAGVLVGAAPFQLSGIAFSPPIIFWDGRIDEVGFWKRVLTSDERTSLYNSGAGLAYPFTSGLTTTRRRMLAGVG